MARDESFDDRWSRMATLLITLYAIKRVKADQLEPRVGWPSRQSVRNSKIAWSRATLLVGDLPAESRASRTISIDVLFFTWWRCGKVESINERDWQLSTGNILSQRHVLIVKSIIFIDISNWNPLFKIKWIVLINFIKKAQQRSHEMISWV